LGEILFREELLALAAGGLDVTFALTRDVASRSSDYSRRVDEDMMSAVIAKLAASPGRVFVCGGTAFVETASRSMIQCGIPASIVRTERFGK
jgi:NAD(P)H-flavin reductase